MTFIENPDHWRVSKSGYSIKTGWATDTRIVASYHNPHESPLDAKRFQQWLEDADRICELHNAMLATAIDASEPKP